MNPSMIIQSQLLAKAAAPVYQVLFAFLIVGYFYISHKEITRYGSYNIYF
jgi:hypothetical protein